MINNHSYILPDKKTKIIFSEKILTYMFSLAQNKPYMTESGGQIFCKNPDDANIIIDEITGPYPTDKRSRYSWIPDVKQMSNDRELLFGKGFYIAGLWHTHPELKPKSSSKDRMTGQKHLQLLDPVYKGFLLITMGNGGKFPILSVEYLERKNYQWHTLISN
ncbi:MPN domain-containing protein [Entomomonas asaccharolytica]|uniref:JAB domain-containing protein n=1 Tax=Entomomonas asaccharolytica TaxID=2785331 RepID=A0A974RXC3_9GAMM|nr:hypothetical protein [Entomomonas asaccharolytica]QQP86030.1 hypothetical protein JHT90_01890 [Entomomonas asaccharolytica]